MEQILKYWPVIVFFIGAFINAIVTYNKVSEHTDDIKEAKTRMTSFEANCQHIQRERDKQSASDTTKFAIIDQKLDMIIDSCGEMKVDIKKLKEDVNTIDKRLSVLESASKE